MAPAVFTIAQDEIDLLPLWVNHYKTYAPHADMYVLDHDTQGDACLYLAHLKEKMGVNVVPVHNKESFDYGWLTRVVEDFMGFLLRSYDAVLFSEVDELVLPSLDTNHGYPGLVELLAAKLKAIPVVRATGRCVVHHHPGEPGMQWNKPLLAQRQHWYRSNYYSKVCAASMRVYYGKGFHTAYNIPDALEPDPDVVCLHLHQADYQTTLRRHQRNAGRFWSPEYRLSPQGIHQRLDNPADLERYLLSDLDNPRQFAALEDIPLAYKEQYLVCKQA